jgi:hypothetical protein
MINANASIVIITVHRGPLKFLKQTLKSIDNQLIEPHHNIVIAKDIGLYQIQGLKKKNRSFIINKDTSIYNAMNIALQHKIIKNNFIIFLNSGDYFFNKRVIFNIKKYFSTTKVLIGKQVLKSSNTTFHIKNYFYFKKTFLPHGSFIINSSLVISSIKKILFDEKRLIDSDGLWMNKIIRKARYQLSKLNLDISILSLGGISTNPTINTVMIYYRINLFLFFKESLKLIIFFFFSKNIYYKIIYFYKYDFKFFKYK